MQVKKRAIFLIIIAAVVFIAATWMRAYKSFLIFFGKEATASVLSYTQQGPLWNIRQGDWEINYRFPDESGRFSEGSATFAPKKRPRPSPTIAVRYLPFAPTVSAPAGYITSTGMILYAKGCLALFFGLRFWKASKAEDASNGSEAEDGNVAITK